MKGLQKMINLIEKFNKAINQRTFRFLFPFPPQIIMIGMLIDKIRLDFWHKSQFVVRENTVLGKYTKYIFWQKNGFLWYFEGFSALLQFTLSWNCRFLCNLNLMFQLIFSLQGKILDFFLILWGFECTTPICPF